MTKLSSNIKTGSHKIIWENTAALMTLTVLNYVLPFITLPYLSRVLAVDKLGLVFFAQVFIEYFWRLTMFGFDFSGVRSVAINRDNHYELIRIFNSILWVQIILLAISFIILSLMICCLNKFRPDALVYYYTFLSVIAQILLFQWFYQGMERMKFITVLNVTTKTVALLLIFTFVKRNEDYCIVPLLNSLGGLVSGIISVFIITHRFGIKFVLPSSKEVWEQFKYSWQFFLSKICIAFYRSTNAFVLGLVLSSASVAYFVSADKIFWGVLGLFGAFVNAIFPFMSKNKDIVFFKKVLKYAILLSIGASIFLLFASKFLIVAFFTDKMLPSVAVLKILCVSFVFYFLVDLLGFPLLGAFNYVKETNQGYILGGIYNAFGLLILYLSKSITIYNVAVLVTSTFFVMFIHRVYYINKFKLLAINQINIGDNYESTDNLLQSNR